MSSNAPGTRIVAPGATIGDDTASPVVNEEVTALIAAEVAQTVSTSGGGSGVSADALGTANNPVTTFNAARPTGLAVVYWYCATQPTHAISGDVWDQATATAPTFTADTPPAGTVGTAYSYTFAATGASSYAVTSGTLPAGLALSSGGVLSGTPSSVATSTFVVTATGTGGSTATGTLSVAIGASGTVPTITTTSPLPAATVGTAYTSTLAATGSPTSWTITSGSVPGLTLSNSGVLSGTPTTAATDTITVTATNGTGTSSPVTFSLTVSAAATVPGAPTGVTATAGVGSASVAFTAPASNGGAAITSYLVTASTGQTATGTASPITVTGLTGGTAVTFTVKATNSVGTGAASAVSNSVTPTAAPSIVQSNYLTTGSSATATLNAGTTAGNTVIVLVADQSGHTFSVAGLTPLTAWEPPSGPNPSIQAFYATGVTAGETSWAITSTEGLSGNATWYAMEFHNLAIGGVDFETAVATQGSGTPVITGSTPAAGGEFVLAVCGVQSTNASSAFSTVTAGWNQVTTAAAAFNVLVGIWWQTSTAGTAPTLTAACSESQINFTSGMVAFIV